MSKLIVRITAAVLCLLLLFGLVATAFADELPEAETGVGETVVTIATAEEFLEFAENCRLDSYSIGVTFYLEADVDLAGTEIEPIPYFGGIFDGNCYTVSGLKLTGAGSYRGLFRYVAAGATVRNLNVAGKIAPEGSGCYVGGIAGHNAGRIENCTFSGTVTGAEQVGGIAGCNALSGVIQDCTASGTVSGTHFIGGIAGISAGVIRGCENRAGVNTTVVQNSVEITDITLDALTGTESAATVTDIGGIAGISAGVIRSCENRGDVGYAHIGYNVGGIAGSQKGYLADCVNRGIVSGRKEVGGIAGQMEPAVYMEFSQDTLQLLQQQLGVMSTLAGQASANAQNGAADIAAQLSGVGEYVDDAREALEMLLPTEEEPIPDADTLLAAQNALGAALTGMQSSLNGAAGAAQKLAADLGRDLQALMNQMDALMATAQSGAEGVGGSILDVSDADTEGDLIAKITLCRNLGDVLGDRNVGGILGAASYENDLDPEDDLTVLGDLSMNYDLSLRAVVLGCENQGYVTSKTGNAGGIAGWMQLGLIRTCSNSGNVTASGGTYVGGIVGKSEGFVRGCAAKCVLEGTEFVGGIAGQGRILSGNTAMVRLSAREKLGSIAGWVEDLTGEGENAPVLGNFYLAVDGDPGGIDGISYAGKAQCVSEEVFFGAELLLDVFHTVTVRFVHESGNVHRVQVGYGQALTPERIPAVTPKDGYNGYWDGLAEADVSRVTFDMTFHAAYDPHASVVAAQMTDESGQPLLLLQGNFPGAQTASVQPLEDSAAVEAWSFTVPEDASVSALRLRVPQGQDPENLTLEIRGADGTWRVECFTLWGSYLVFPVAQGDGAFRLMQVQTGPDPLVLGLVGAAAAALLTAAAVIVIRHRKK